MCGMRSLSDAYFETSNEMTPTAPFNNPMFRAVWLETKTGKQIAKNGYGCEEAAKGIAVQMKSCAY
jgi:hypothetical protein